MKKKKIIRKILIIFTAIVLLILFFASTIARWYIHKNDNELLGREVNIGKLSINYLTISIDIKDFVLFEENKVDTFVAFNHLNVNAQPWRLLDDELSIKQFSLDGLYVKVEQNGSSFNFDDLIPPKDTVINKADTTKKKKETKFSFKNVSITNSNLNYIDKEIDNLISLHNINLSLPLLAWNNQKSEVGINFKIGEKGNLNIKADVNNEKETYTVRTKIDSLDLTPFSIYIKPHLNTTEINGSINTNILAEGSLSDFMNIVFSGNIGIYNFLLPDSNGSPVFSTKELSVKLDSVNIKNNYFGVNNISLNNPKFWIETGNENSNIERLIENTKTSSADSLNSTDTSTISKSTPPLRYSIDSIAIIGGELNYTSLSLNRPFKYNISELALTVKNISESEPKVPATISMILNKKGSFRGNANINMLDSRYFSFNGKIKKLDLVSFSPFSEYYISYPVSQGYFNYNINLDMTPTHLSNNNSISINELEFGKKTGDSTAIKVPVRMGLYILKDKDDKIAFDLPVTGNPSEPEFSLRKIIWDTFSKFMIKTTTEPFSALAGLVGADPESIEKIEFDFTQDTLATEQRNTLDKLAEILEKKPDLVFSLTQETPNNIEIEELAIKQVAINYLLSTNKPTTASDSLSLTNSWKDTKENSPEFKEYVNVKYGIDDSSSLGNKCITIVGKNAITKMHIELMNKRNLQVEKYLLSKSGVEAENVVVHNIDMENARTQFEVPTYKIEVSLK